MIRNILHGLFAAVVVLGALLSTKFLFDSSPEAQAQKRSDKRLLVEAVTVAHVSLRIPIRAQGSIGARQRLPLSSEVSGRVVERHPDLRPGAYVDAGDVLVQIETADYEAALVQARSTVTQARLRLAQEMALARQAREDWQAMQLSQAPDPLVLRQPQLEDARAAVQAAEAAVADAERRLARCRIVAPFAGRVLAVSVERFQVIGVGAPLVELAPVDYAEVRLPLRNEQVLGLDLDLSGRAPPTTAPVSYTALSAGLPGAWQGRVLRSEAERDARSRFVYLVASLEDPFALEQPDNQPLPFGTYVEAVIQAPVRDDLVRLPASALRLGDRVAVIEADGSLRLVGVAIHHREGDLVWVSGELQPGERICISPLDLELADIQVRVLGDESEEEMEAPGDAGPSRP